MSSQSSQAQTPYAEPSKRLGGFNSSSYPQGPQGKTASSSRVSVYQFLNFKEYLREFYLAKKGSASTYSYAVFSQKAGLKSPNYLKLVIDGARGITNDNILSFAKGLGLTPTETIYFENLVLFNQAKTEELKQYYLHRLTHSPIPDGERAPIRMIKDEWDYYSNWYHTAIRELVLMPEFKEDPKWIADKLKNRISPAEAKASLELLIRMGFLVQSEGSEGSSKLTQSNSQIRYYSPVDISNLIVSRFHQSTAELAVESIQSDPVSERDFSGVTLAVTSASLPEIKKILTETRRLINERFSLPVDTQMAEQVYQLNLQLIPLTAAKKALKKENENEQE